MGKFTKIENDIIESLLIAGLSITALSCALFLLRKLNGFHKEEDMISNKQIAKGIGKSIRSVINGMEELQLMKIVALVKRGVSKKACNIWCFEKNVSKWRLVNKVALVKKRGRTSENLGKKLVKDTATTKEILQKKDTKERELATLLKELVEVIYPTFNETYGTSYSSTSIIGNYTYWRGFFSVKQIIEAIRKSPNHRFVKENLKGKLKPDMMFRQKYSSGEPANWIDDFLNTKANEEKYINLN